MKFERTELEYIRKIWKSMIIQMVSENESIYFRIIK